MKNPMVLLGILTLTTTLAIPAVAADRTVEIAPFAGYGFGGDFKEYSTNTSLDVDEQPVYGLTVDWEAAEQTQYEFFFSHQNTKLKSSSGSTPSQAKTDLTISYAHIGGLLNFGDDRFSPFIVGGLGATHFNPDSYDSKTKFSFNLGGGFKVFFAENVGLRFEGRALGTVVDNNVWFSSGSGGTQIGVAGDMFWQFQLNLGIIIAF